MSHKKKIKQYKTINLYLLLKFASYGGEENEYALHLGWKQKENKNK